MWKHHKTSIDQSKTIDTFDTYHSTPLRTEMSFLWEVNFWIKSPSPLVSIISILNLFTCAFTQALNIIKSPIHPL